MSYDTRLREAREKIRVDARGTCRKLVGCAKQLLQDMKLVKASQYDHTKQKSWRLSKVDANFIFQDEMVDLTEENASPEEMDELVKKIQTSG